MSLNDKQIVFVNEYVKDWNATQAAIRAGYSEKTAQEQGSRLLSHVMVKEAIDERKAELAAMAAISPAWVLRQWKMIADADPNDLTQLRRVNCRHCYGYGNRYQWTEGEYMQAVDDAIAKGKEPPDGMGGFGFDVNAEPADDCPECGSRGIELLHMADTRKVKGNARRLYAGVQKTKDGLKIQMRDQDAALLNIAKYLGMLVDKKEITGANGGPLALANLTADDLTDDQLAAILQASDDDNA